MKKLPALFFYAIACTIFLSSCWRNDDNGNISLSFNETDHYYTMNAHFSRNRTRDVERYMDSRIGKRNNMSFVNSNIDGVLGLDDHTTFYIKKAPGIVKIKLDKEKNSQEAYENIRSMCEG